MRHRIYDYFFLVLLASILYGVGALLAPFVGALVSALLCVVTFYPIHQKLSHLMPRRSATFHAAVSDILVLILFVGPLLSLMWVLFAESAAVLPVIKQGSAAVAQWREGNIGDTLPWMEHLRYVLAKGLGVRRAQFQDSFMSTVDRGLQYISVAGAFLATHVLTFILDLAMMLFISFFMFRDGHKWLNYIATIVPLRRRETEELMSRIQIVVVSLGRGLFLTSLIQGVLSTVGYVIVGADGAVLLGTLTALMGLLPVIGTFGIWVPTGLFFILKGSYAKGVFLLLWGVLVVVGLVDVIVRPYLVGRRAHLPLFILFFALMGGAEVWGAKGLILGPLIASLAPLLLGMYRDRFSRQTSYKEVEPSLRPRAIHVP